MTYMLCRNTVNDFQQWKAIFNSHKELHQKAGLRLIGVWRATDNPNNIFFNFEIESIEKAQAFIDDPASAEAGKAAGVIEGEYHYAESAGGYE